MGYNSKELKTKSTARKLSNPKDIDYKSKMGYRDDSPFVNRPFIDINTPSGYIDMSNTGIPLFANGYYLPPYSGQYYMGTDVVREIPAYPFDPEFAVNSGRGTGVPWSTTHSGKNTGVPWPTTNTNTLTAGDYNRMRGLKPGLFAKGGEPSAEKAKRMLKDGTVYGRELTDAQRRYFASIAGTDEYGNEPEDQEQQDDSENMEEYKKGGYYKSLPKGGTSKNIKSSINQIIGKRNELLYGPSGKKYFIPFQKGGRVPIYVDNPNDPRLRAYNDSLRLYKAYQMQDKLMGPGSKPVKDSFNEWTTKELKEGRKTRIVKGLEDYGPLSNDFQSESHQFKKGYDAFTSRKEDEKLIRYYKSLGFTDKDIMYHSSPDIVSDRIRAIGTYYDGTANSPIYKKPVQPVEYKKSETFTEKSKQKSAEKGIPQRENMELIKPRQPNLVYFNDPGTLPILPLPVRPRPKNLTGFSAQGAKFLGTTDTYQPELLQQMITPMMYKKQKGGLAFPQQPTADKFYERGYVPNYPMGYYAQGGAMEELAFPQQPPADMYFSGYPFQPEYAHGGSHPYVHYKEGGYYGGPIYPMAEGGIAYPQQPPADMFFSGYPFQPEYAKGGAPCYECGGAYMQPGGAVPYDDAMYLYNYKKKWNEEQAKFKGTPEQGSKTAANLINTPESKKAWKLAEKYNQPFIVNERVPSYGVEGAMNRYSAYELGKMPVNPANIPVAPPAPEVLVDNTPASESKLPFKYTKKFVGFHDPIYKGTGYGVDDPSKLGNMDVGGSVYNYGMWPATEYGGSMTPEIMQSGRLEAFFAGGPLKKSKVPKAQKGMQAPQGYDIDNVLDSNKNVFAKFLGQNTMDVLDQEAQQEAQEQFAQQVMQYGGGNYGFNPMASQKANMYGQQLDQMNNDMINSGANFLQSSGQLFGGMWAANQAKKAAKAAEKETNAAQTQARYGYNLPKHQEHGIVGGNNLVGPYSPEYVDQTKNAAANSNNLTKEDVYKLWDEKQKEALQQQLAQIQAMYNAGYYPTAGTAGQPGMGSYIPYNAYGPYWKTKTKTWGNAPTALGIGQMQQAAGVKGQSGSSQMTPEQVAQMQEYWKNKGMDFQYKEKRGLLGKWLGPKKISMSLKTLPGQTSASPSSPTAASTLTNTTTPDPSSSYDLRKIGSTPVNKEDFMQGMGNIPAAPEATGPIQTGIPYAEENVSLPGAYRYGGLSKYVGGGNPELNTTDYGFEFQQKRKPGMFANPSTAPWVLTGLDFGANLASRDEARNLERKMNQMYDASQQYNAVGMDKGDYLKDVYAGQSFRPDETGAKVEPWAMGNLGAMNIGNPQMSKFGGTYAQGGQNDVYYMTDDEIEQFMAAGGQIEYLD